MNALQTWLHRCRTFTPWDKPVVLLNGTRYLIQVRCCTRCGRLQLRWCDAAGKPSPKPVVAPMRWWNEDIVRKSERKTQ